MTRPRKIPTQAGSEPGTFRPRGGCLTTGPPRRSCPRGHTVVRRDEQIQKAWRLSKEINISSPKCTNSSRICVVLERVVACLDVTCLQEVKKCQMITCAVRLHYRPSRWYDKVRSRYVRKKTSVPYMENGALAQAICRTSILK